MNAETLGEVLKKHADWLAGRQGGTRADLRGADLRGAVLTGAVLTGAVLRDAVLTRADLARAVLTRADLARADLRGADLRDAVLTGADLRGADLRDAVLTGVPVLPDIHTAVYAAASQPGALNMKDWHTCDTTHCRAGWVVALTGDVARGMEICMGTAAVAALIYAASDPKLDRVPDFHASNEEALADMKRLAEGE